ncbi:MAG TPA: hypothetical protein VHN59_01560 [Chitinophagaceae bacterium]|nr:hypothetical protein [Chitinophagaceae bacterium]
MNVLAQTPELPESVLPYVQSINYGNLGNYKPAVKYTVISKNLVRVHVSWALSDSVKQDDLQITILPAFKAGFNWAPHLTPDNDHIIAQHVFRTPAMIGASAQKQLILIPDIDILKKGFSTGWYMDMNAPENKFTFGLSRSAVKEHVLFVRKPGAAYAPGKIEYGFYIMTASDKKALFDPWRNILSFYWKNWGAGLYKSGEPLMNKNLEPYVRQTYDWAFNTWKKSVWQDFTIKGKDVGAPVFIVNVTQSPNYQGYTDEREFRSIWNQAWFNSLRSAEGLFRYARRKKDSTLMSYALKTKELALSFPQTDGIFYSVIGTEMEKVEKDGKLYNRSKGWDKYYFGNSNRNPYSWDFRESPYHVLDMSFTAYLMLTWYQELEKDERLLSYAKRYADKLIKLQREDGFFPGWLSLKDLKPLEYLNKSPESAMSVTFLLTLFKSTNNNKYLAPALRAMDSIIAGIIPVGQWEDFETYWSCSRYGSDSLVDKKVKRNNMFKQNNFSMYWTAEALLNCYKITRNKKYIQYGQRVLDEMLMTQASWQPPYMYVNVLGGFGVMNADGEWDDSRQSLFSELIIRYGKELNNTEYIQRGLAALRASFVMMYTPLNAKTKVQWERKWPFLGKEDYGFMMENYGHGGETDPAGIGIGEFTIYDWGNGAASEAYNRMIDHYGKGFINDN